jgi:Xaa-Pro aminopeptidase
MDRENLDALFITEPLNYHYFTGASPSFSYARYTIVVFPKKGKPVIVVHQFVEESTRRETWIENVKIYEKMAEFPIHLIKEVFESLGLTEGRIGAELGYEQRLGLAYNDFVKLQKELPKLEFVDASHVFWQLRLKKSEAEVKLLRKACQITSEAFEECFRSIKEGITEREVEKIFHNAIIKRGGSKPWCFINSSPFNYNVISGSPTNQKLKRGNTIWIDGGCSYSGYWSDFCRIGSIGVASEKQEKMHEMTLKITQLCVDMIEPGVKVADIAQTCEKEAKKMGLELTFRAGRYGHGIGLMLTEPPHIATYDKTVLEPGMVITIEPGFVTDYGVFQNEEEVLVTQKGHEILSKASTELRRI